MNAPAPSPAPRCQACDREMEEGHLPDATSYTITVGERTIAWAPGRAQAGVLGDTRVPAEKQFPIRAWRCPACGVLALVAHPRAWRRV